jgi:hypothetical protein
MGAENGIDPSNVQSIKFSLRTLLAKNTARWRCAPTMLKAATIKFYTLLPSFACAESECRKKLVL